MYWPPVKFVPVHYRTTVFAVINTSISGIFRASPAPWMWINHLAAVNMILDLKKLVGIGRPLNGTYWLCLAGYV